ncbi:NAD(P)H-hydrate epimerase [Oceanisphaera litoralis]|uniref:NAD(P)H-hydrate dehydratase n=1 Tax=Oceanisphaera litoralis TaxID=225144 RepID=UPI00195DA582|nr:NAD(P)H-hydrate dehydratase [Oceanisphaera litoralis]MBM7456710.1 NAD(P)H-hydrate epimerase [Oceanisphaera litoralis]
MGIIGLEKPHSLTQSLWTAEQIRVGERQAAASCGMAMFELMTRAGLAVFELARARWPHARHWWVFTGGGNNGGDGYVVARLARAAGIRVQLVQMGDPGRLSGDAATARDHYRADGGAIESLNALQGTPDLIIDALLGTGLSGNVRESALGHIRQINQTQAPVLAVDVPSGLCADTGRILGAAVEAGVTLSFVGLKPGLLTGRGPDVTGQVLLASLGIQPRLQQTPVASLMQWEPLRRQLPRRRRGAHKGEAGRLLVAGGNAGMNGAIRLAGEAALRCATGLVRLLSHPEHAHLLNLQRPELMTAVFPECDDWHWGDALVLGPGLGRDAWARGLFEAAYEAGIAAKLPMVIDADGLWWLARGRDELPLTDNRVLTPHPGEAAMLLGCKTAEVEADRLAAVRAIQQQYGGVVVLKGAGSLIADEQHVRLCHYGNPGMASGGMGDVLSGIIGAFMAQGLTPIHAASVAVCLHGLAGDRAATDGGMLGLLASDLFSPLRSLINQDDEHDNKHSDPDACR